MSIEQEIWDEFKGLSGQELIDERVPYATAKAHFGMKYEDTISRVNNINGNQYIKDDVDIKIDRLLARGGSVDWNELEKLYPVRPAVKLPKEKPPVKFRTQKERLEINDILLTDWDSHKQRLHLMFPDEEKAAEYLINKRWGDNLTCPRCAYSDQIFLLSNIRQRYKCANCHFKFSEKVGTMFQGTQLPLIKWYEAIYLLTSIKTRKISTLQLARAIDTTQLTSWSIAKKIQSKVEDEFLSKIKHGLGELSSK